MPLSDGLPSDESPSLREYEQRWRDHQRVHEQEERARDNAVETINNRLQGMNEFRQTVADLQSQLLTKVEFNAWREGMSTQQRWMITTLIAIAALGVTAFVAFVVKG